MLMKVCLVNVEGDLGGVADNKRCVQVQSEPGPCSLPMALCNNASKTQVWQSFNQNILNYFWSFMALQQLQCIRVYNHILFYTHTHTLALIQCLTGCIHTCTRVCPVNRNSCSRFDWQSLKVRFKCESTRLPALLRYLHTVSARSS